MWLSLYGTPGYLNSNLTSPANMQQLIFGTINKIMASGVVYHV